MISERIMSVRGTAAVDMVRRIRNVDLSSEKQQKWKE
jgi:hypothetical protein